MKTTLYYIIKQYKDLGTLFIGTTDKTSISLIRSVENPKYQYMQGYDMIQQSLPILEHANKVLLIYLSGQDLPQVSISMPYGTNFQKKVWNATRQVKYGQTKSYKDIANSIKHNKSARAIGNALNANPITILIPCHRIIKSSGNHGNYALGEGVKEQLIKLEQVTTRQAPLTKEDKH